MMFEKYLNQNVVIELKNGRKYFGELVAIDKERNYICWITLKKRSKTQDFCDTEIARVEGLE